MTVKIPWTKVAWAQRVQFSKQNPPHAWLLPFQIQPKISFFVFPQDCTALSIYQNRQSTEPLYEQCLIGNVFVKRPSSLLPKHELTAQHLLLMLLHELWLSLVVGVTSIHCAIARAESINFVKVDDEQCRTSGMDMHTDLDVCIVCLPLP